MCDDKIKDCSLSKAATVISITSPTVNQGKLKKSKNTAAVTAATEQAPNGCVQFNEQIFINSLRKRKRTFEVCDAANSLK